MAASIVIEEDSGTDAEHLSCAHKPTSTYSLGLE
jgi:hypothetical protein